MRVAPEGRVAFSRFDLAYQCKHHYMTRSTPAARDCVLHFVCATGRLRTAYRIGELALSRKSRATVDKHISCFLSGRDSVIACHHSMKTQIDWFMEVRRSTSFHAIRCDDGQCSSGSEPRRVASRLPVSSIQPNDDIHLQSCQTD
jgi:hypothetical protein